MYLSCTHAGRPFGELMLRRKRPGAFLAALMRGLSAEESPDMPLQAATSFMTTMIESMQTALKPCHQQACHAIMTDLLEQLPDDIVTALQQVRPSYYSAVVFPLSNQFLATVALISVASACLQCPLWKLPPVPTAQWQSCHACHTALILQAVSHMAEQGQLKTDMLIALVELPLEVASEVFQAAFRADAFNDTRNASDDALLFDAATVDAPPEQSLALLTAALVRLGCFICLSNACSP